MVRAFSNKTFYVYLPVFRYVRPLICHDLLRSFCDLPTLQLLHKSNTSSNFHLTPHGIAL